MTTLKTFLRMNRIGMNAELVDRNPNMSESSWSLTATHWRCVLTFERRKLTTYFSQGSAICREPTVEDVLNALALDASSVDNVRDFEGFAIELGYDPDSRKAERIYKACQALARGLRRFMADRYEALLGCEDL